MTEVSVEDYFGSGGGGGGGWLPVRKGGDFSLSLYGGGTDLTDTKREYFDTQQKMVYEAKERKVYKRQPGKRKWTEGMGTVEEF